MKFIQFSGKLCTSSKRFCKSGIDFELVAAPAAVPVFAVDDVDAVADDDEAEVDVDELCCGCFDFCDASLSFWSSNITCLKYSIGGTYFGVTYEIRKIS